MYAISSVKWLDEFIVVNTGDENNSNLATLRRVSEDIGKDIRIVKYPKDQAFSFAKARNLAVDHTCSDYFLKIDADEVYYDSLATTVRDLDFGCDVYCVEFYHFMFDVFHYQDIYQKEVLFKNGLRWTGAVHEVIAGDNLKTGYLPDRFCHFGYARPQAEVFRKWQLYAQLDGLVDAYKDQDPEHILDNRTDACTTFQFIYPEAMADYVKSAPMVLKEEH